MKLTVLRDDITSLTVDAIVTAANVQLQGGGGVDGAIHRAAGPELLAACRIEAPCPTGRVRVTPAFRLRARIVIHAVGPIWSGGDKGELVDLQSCYYLSLNAAQVHGCRTIAFPCISTGVYGYPQEPACIAAVHAVRIFMEARRNPLDEVVFSCFTQADADLYRAALTKPINQLRPKPISSPRRRQPTAVC
jgi:O-acetyl-ADP-ribose deacetylase